jgi:Domain of unknown function (DUF4091)
MIRRVGRPLLVVALGSLGLIALPHGASAARSPRAWIADDGSRVPRDDLGSPLSRGDDNSIWRPDGPVRLRALRGEVVAFQVVVEASDATLDKVEVNVDAGLDGVSVERFVEHYIEVRRRSGNDRRPRESLGWSEEARPIGADLQGALPDALIPVDMAPPFAPYPMVVAQRRNGVVWVDVTVPVGAPPGGYAGSVVVTAGGAPVARIPVELTINAAVLPYRPVSFVAYYGYGELETRVGDADRVERQLFQLLHAHHVDALASVRDVEDAERLLPALDGSLFTSARGYRGPGEGVAPAAVAIGPYGSLGEPTRAELRAVEEISAKIPDSVADVVLYAADEDCESPVGPAWRRLVAGSAAGTRVRVAHSCGWDPRHQDVDLALVPADAFRSGPSAEARRSGRKVWISNGALPRAGTLLLDADLTSLRADGWIASFHDVGRWFLWETTFWDDSHAGGRGPVDPFVTAESFHNRQGDTALLDGLLVYPGTQRGRFAAHSIGFPGVLPSMRLKNLRRGIQDAGYVALAREARPAEADHIVAELVPAALDELHQTSPSQLPRGGARFEAAREALRALIPAGAVQTPAMTAAVLGEAARARLATVTAERHGRMARIAALIAALIAAFAAAVFALRPKIPRKIRKIPASASLADPARRTVIATPRGRVRYTPFERHRKSR